jgi:hypothetical protein
VRAPFALERYLEELRDRTAWAPDCAIEECPGPRVPREVLYRIGHLWALALLDDRFETLLLPVLATASPILDACPGLARDFLEERLQSKACLLLIDGADEDEWPGNVRFVAAR